MNKKIFASLLMTIAMAATSSSAQISQESYFDQNKKEVVCAEPLPIFTLRYESNPNQQQVKILCGCIWNTFPVDGWEQKTSRLIRGNQDPGWRGKALISRFGEALKTCGGMNL